MNKKSLAKEKIIHHQLNTALNNAKTLEEHGDFFLADKTAPTKLADFKKWFQERKISAQNLSAVFTKIRHLLQGCRLFTSPTASSPAGTVSYERLTSTRADWEKTMADLESGSEISKDLCQQIRQTIEAIILISEKSLKEVKKDFQEQENAAVRKEYEQTTFKQTKMPLYEILNTLSPEELQIWNTMSLTDLERFCNFYFLDGAPRSLSEMPVGATKDELLWQTAIAADRIGNSIDRGEWTIRGERQYLDKSCSFQFYDILEKLQKKYPHTLYAHLFRILGEPITDSFSMNNNLAIVDSILAASQDHQSRKQELIFSKKFYNIAAARLPMLQNLQIKFSEAIVQDILFLQPLITQIPEYQPEHAANKSVLQEFEKSWQELEAILRQVYQEFLTTLPAGATDPYAGSDFLAALADNLDPIKCYLGKKFQSQFAASNQFLQDFAEQHQLSDPTQAAVFLNQKIAEANANQHELTPEAQKYLQYGDFFDSHFARTHIIKLLATMRCKQKEIMAATPDSPPISMKTFTLSENMYRFITKIKTEELNTLIADLGRGTTVNFRRQLGALNCVFKIIPADEATEQIPGDEILLKVEVTLENPAGKSHTLYLRLCKYRGIISAHSNYRKYLLDIFFHKNNSNNFQHAAFINFIYQSIIQEFCSLKIIQEQRSAELAQTLLQEEAKAGHKLEDPLAFMESKSTPEILGSQWQYLGVFSNAAYYLLNLANDAEAQLYANTEVLPTEESKIIAANFGLYPYNPRTQRIFREGPGLEAFKQSIAYGAFEKIGTSTEATPTESKLSTIVKSAKISGRLGRDKITTIKFQRVLELFGYTCEIRKPKSSSSHATLEVHKPGEKPLCTTILPGQTYKIGTFISMLNDLQIFGAERHKFLNVLINY